MQKHLIKIPNKQDLEFLERELGVFRDAGLRLLIGNGKAQSLLVENISGHLVIGPTQYEMGLSFLPEDRLDEEQPLPSIIKQPYVHCHNTSVHLGNRTYLLYPTTEALDSPYSLVHKAPMYALDHEWLRDLEIVRVSI